jgi:hypothetical protein
MTHLDVKRSITRSLVAAAAPLAAITLLAAAPAVAPRTPEEMVATYRSLADAILAADATEENLVRSILSATHAHAQVEQGRAQKAIQAGDSAAARTAIESLAAAVGQIGTEGDSAVGSVRKRLVEGGHHHNAAGEAAGVFDEGFVVVTRAAKQKFLDASRAIGQMAAAPKADALQAEWGKVEAAWTELMKGSR